MNAKLKIENITPDRAHQLLASPFEGQRTKRDSYIDRLAGEMRDGNWKLSPDCILIVKSKLANGQHRMEAVIRAKKAVPFIIMESNDDELYKIIDAGIKRSVGDVIAGQYANMVASVARWAVMYDVEALTPGGQNPDKSKLATRSRIIEYVEAHHEGISSLVALCATLYANRRIAPVGTAAAVAHLAIRETGKEKEVRQFITNVYDGESGTQDAAWDFRERMVKNNSSRARIPRQYVFALMVKSLRSYIKGTRLGTLKMADGEPMPRFK